MADETAASATARARGSSEDSDSVREVDNSVAASESLEGQSDLPAKSNQADRQETANAQKAKPGTEQIGPPRVVNVMAEAGPYKLSLDRVRRVVSRGHDEFPNGFPLFAGMQLNEESTSQQDANTSTAAGSISGGFGGSYIFKHPNLILDLGLKGSDASGKTKKICNVYGPIRAKDDAGREVVGSQAGPWLKLLVDGVDYRQETGRTAIHLALPTESKGARYLASIDGELLVADGTLQTLEFKGKELSKATTKKADKITARLDSVSASAAGIDVTIAVSPPLSNNDSKLDALRQEKDIRDLMKQDMLSNCPGRVSLVLVDSAGRSHYGKSEEQGNGSSSRSAGGSGSTSWSSSGETNGKKWSRGGSSSARKPNAAGLVDSRFHFAALPDGVEIKSITCVVTTCLSEPQRVPFHFEQVPLPE
jgi:hypothetical protein